MLNDLLDRNVTDLGDIYTHVVNKLGVPRPTVRRVARSLRIKYLKKIQILQQNIDKRNLIK